MNAEQMKFFEDAKRLRAEAQGYRDQISNENTKENNDSLRKRAHFCDDNARNAEDLASDRGY